MNAGWVFVLLGKVFVTLIGGRWGSGGGSGSGARAGRPVPAELAV